MKTKQNIKYLFSLLILLGLLMNTSCDDPKLSDLTGITSFAFTDDIIKDFPMSIDNSALIIQNGDSLPYQFDVSNLTAKFSLISGSTIKVNDVEQISGESKNNFTNTVVYVVTAEDGVTTKNYKVNLHVAKLNPEAVQWNQKSPNAFDDTYETQEYFYLKEKHWVIIGKKFKWFSNSPESKLYNSADGVSWTEQTPTGDFPVGYDHNIVISNNKAYVVGYVSGVDNSGSDQPTLENNLFTTEDGIVWKKTDAALDDAGRILSPVFNLSDKIYAFGGNLQGGYGSFTGSKTSDAPFFPAAAISASTLISTDGQSFTSSAEYSTTMPKRTLAAGYIYNNTMYVAGGLNTEGHPLSDVWSSPDGVTWTQVSSGAFTPRIKASTVVYDNRVWMFGGQLADGNVTSEILVSDDGGVTWNKVEMNQILPDNFTPRCNADVSVDADGNIWIVGGETVTSVTYEEENGYVDEIKYKVLTDVWIGKLNKL